MNLNEVRPSFTAFLIGSDSKALAPLAAVLESAGYQVVRFTELTAAFSEFSSNPPHFLFFNFSETGFRLNDVIPQVRLQLPETHIFVVAPATQRSEAAQLLDFGVYDVLFQPLSERELIAAVDRAAERDYYMYAKEQESSAEKSADWYPHLLRLFKVGQGEEVIKIFVDSLSQVLGGLPVVHFRYLSNRRVLVATQSCGLDQKITKNLGVDLNIQSPDFRSSQLRDPNGMKVLSDMVKVMLGTEVFQFHSLNVLSDIQGLILVLGRKERLDQDPAIENGFIALEKSLALLEYEKRMHSASMKDLGTELLNRPHFIERASQEVSRARRLQAPVSLALVSLDQYSQIVETVGQEEAQTVLKMLARIFEKHSRANDILGRTGGDEFGLLLPHTHRDGALVKCERLRRIVESADFSKVIKAFPHLSISLGVSEYPSMAHDVDEMMGSADEALFEVRKVGNKTCLAHVPDNFEADFVIESRGS